MSPPDVAHLAAVVFDFDGLIVDTETPIFENTAAALGVLGHTLTIEGWSTVVGLGEEASFAAMCRTVGAEIDEQAFDAAYALQDRSWRDHLPPLPGVAELLGELVAAGVPCGIASSSPSGWVEGHLDRLGLRGHFEIVATEDRVGGATKPAPDAYLLACSVLGTDPQSTLAIEDSAHGLAAAVAAGMPALAVPSEITRFGDFTAARRVVDSLADVGVSDLSVLLAAR